MPLARQVEEARGRRREGGAAQVDDVSGVGAAEGSSIQTGQVVVPSATTVTAMLADPFASAHDVATAHGALVLQRRLADDEYPTYSEWKASVDIMATKFWLCIRCRITNRRGDGDDRCRQCHDLRTNILVSAPADELRALEEQTHHLAYGRNLVRWQLVPNPTHPSSLYACLLLAFAHCFRSGYLCAGVPRRPRAAHFLGSARRDRATGVR